MLVLFSSKQIDHVLRSNTELLIGVAVRKNTASDEHG